MSNVKTVFVEKKKGFDVEAIGLFEDFKTNLSIKTIEKVRVLNKYTIGNLSDEYEAKAISSIFSEPMVDEVFVGELNLGEKEWAFCVEYLPGQYDQRAASSEECYEILTAGEKIKVKSAKVVIIYGNLSKEQKDKIKGYYINPVDSREVEINSKEIFSEYLVPEDVKVLYNFINLTENEIKALHKELSLAMSLADLKLVQSYFIQEKRNPTITEIKVIDTYWSDHCRHTTFLTNITKVEIEEGTYNQALINSFEEYKKSRNFVYGENPRDINLMDIAVLAAKELRKKGLLTDLDESEEINACSIKAKVETDKGVVDYLIMFKNETHNHPTEIEPFGGAATCLGGAIRDPLSGRSYVYQAMRVTGAGDPTEYIEDTLKGKLPQRTITLGAAHGYSSYGNQIGLATGQVAELYHNNYKAKRLEIGAVIGAAPMENVKRERPVKGDIIILLGGRTGRDGLGGATGSSKEHTEESINICGAEVQKGNAPTERKIQRLFRNIEVSTLIKRCNDFGAGGVSVAIGELSEGLDIDLDKVPKKYDGLDGTELAISESQERMAVVVDKNDVEKFINFSNQENIEATVVAEVTDEKRLRMYWRDKLIVDLKREFLDTNGAKSYTEVKVDLPKEAHNVFNKEIKGSIKENWIKTLGSLNVASQKGLVDRFDSTIGSLTVLMPFGGVNQITPAEGMAAKIPVQGGESKDATLMAYGFNPEIGLWSPFHMGYYAVIESLTKLVSMGGDYRKSHLTFQEYFERLGVAKERWGKPFAALLGAFKVQKDLSLAAIGGKDSMSGSFGDLDVPPTLTSFAVAIEKAENVISPEFKEVSSKLVLIKTDRLEDETLNLEQYISNMNKLVDLIKSKKVISAFTLKFGGVSEAISKMAFGNKIGAKLSNLNNQELFGLNPAAVLVEIKAEDFNEDILKGCNYKIIGETTRENQIVIENEVLNLDDLQSVWRNKLEGVFKSETTKVSEEDVKLPEVKSSISAPVIKVAKPKVIIPVFPGNNCEDDCERAFNKAGGDASQFLFKNLTKEMLVESIETLEKEIRKSQIIMIPGGFSAADEPDGSGKFIATVFRNERIKDAVMDLLNNRDGLIIGICNGFQALVKLGLVPYGEIREMNSEMPTLTYNNIGRHMNSLVRTKISSKLSPWFSEVNLGDIHTVPISHGEGRFVASEEVLQEMIKNGQIATQYVDLDGQVSLNMPYNPNGSVLGIEGITSPDGRILGKMAHSERISTNVYKNVPGDFDQKIFQGGINYFK
ncbi:phosphoribosylformylglycinamidine synthase [Clostridium sp. YIM B02551]|uniref:phosphoribosylformylglycinamidine synthase n=1 Tax=Clostridium sp. YIM B02551 TaxID=2910679 RepID=UPI001EEC1344|nr:phosphoribosylformylglycinamidine synthase [Clostridium sp. YIM B02551]